MGLLQERVVLVTGGTSGIGRASAVLFAKEGAKVAVTGRREPEGKEVIKKIEAAGGEAIFLGADLMVVQNIPSLVDQVVAKYGRLDCSFNNAGVAGRGPIDSLDE